MKNPGSFWENPDWYDLHDDASVSGVAREAEHYKEFVLALPPLTSEDHLIDVGTGTGKLVAETVAAYPRVGRVSLVDPNSSKLERAIAKVKEVSPQIKLESHVASVGFQNAWLPGRPGTVVTVGSVLMPVLIHRGGSFQEGVHWIHNALGDILEMGVDGTEFYFLETFAMEFDTGGTGGAVRRMRAKEFEESLEEIGFKEVEWRYRFRDRVVFRGVRRD